MSPVYMKFKFGWLFSIDCGFNYPPLLPKLHTPGLPCAWTSRLVKLVIRWILKSIINSTFILHIKSHKYCSTSLFLLLLVFIKEKDKRPQMLHLFNILQKLQPWKLITWSTPGPEQSMKIDDPKINRSIDDNRLITAD